MNDTAAPRMRIHMRNSITMTAARSLSGWMFDGQGEVGCVVKSSGGRYGCAYPSG